VSASIRKANIRAGHQITDRIGCQHLPTLSHAQNTRGRVNGDPGDIVSLHFDLARVDTAPHLDPERPQLIPGVKHVVAVASGKDGVGKSTTACRRRAS
jgi:Mrp family chromosome partitioning ATPase